MIKNIRIQNYKSLGDVSVDLDPVTVLIGRSGTGKSNFVDAIRFLRDYLRVSDVIGLPDIAWNLIGPTTLQAAVTSFDLQFKVVGIKKNFRYTVGFRWKRPQPTSISAEVAEEKLFLD